MPYSDAARWPTSAHNACLDPAIRPELRTPRAAAQTRIVSVARIRLDFQKSARPFKGIICADISESVCAPAAPATLHPIPQNTASALTLLKEIAPRVTRAATPPGSTTASRLAARPRPSSSRGPSLSRISRCAGLSVHADPEAHAQRALLARRQGRQHARGGLAQIKLNGGVDRQDHALVLDEVAEVRVLLARIQGLGDGCAGEPADGAGAAERSLQGRGREEQRRCRRMGVPSRQSRGNVQGAVHVVNTLRTTGRSCLCASPSRSLQRW
jgi:hypothetical protein